MAGEFSHSPSLSAFLSKHDISISFTSYQSGILYFLGYLEGRLHLHQCAVRHPMGLARSGSRGLVLAAGHQIIRFENPLQAHERVNSFFDACYVPRTVHITGDLDAHDVGVTADGSPIFVNTRMNCLAQPDDTHSFRELWRPEFVSALVDEDRCHLNGLAMRDGVPAFVTAVSQSDTIDGWRDRRREGGVIVSVSDDEIVCRGLSMPHSPRWHNGELWVLNSGSGDLGVIEGFEAGSARFSPRAFLPGFARGLACHENYAFVGLSKPRHQRFEGLELDERLRRADSEAWCGIQVIDLLSGSCVEWFRIDGAVGEIYDLEVLPGVTCPMAISLNTPEAVSFVTWEGRMSVRSSSDSSSDCRSASRFRDVG